MRYVGASSFTTLCCASRTRLRSSAAARFAAARCRCSSVSVAAPGALRLDTAPNAVSDRSAAPDAVSVVAAEAAAGCSRGARSGPAQPLALNRAAASAVTVTACASCVARHLAARQCRRARSAAAARCSIATRAARISSSTSSASATCFDLSFVRRPPCHGLSALTAFDRLYTDRHCGQSLCWLASHSLRQVEQNTWPHGRCSAADSAPSTEQQTVHSSASGSPMQAHGVHPTRGGPPSGFLYRFETRIPSVLKFNAGGETSALHLPNLAMTARSTVEQRARDALYETASRMSSTGDK